MRRLFYAAACVWVLSACGYHLVGQAGTSNTVPAEARALHVQLLASPDDALLAVAEEAWGERMALPLTQQDEPNKAVLTMYIDGGHENLVPISFDSSGIANQYRLTISGSVRMLYQDKQIWQSGVILEQGDVFATGNTVAIEAQREDLAKSLRKSWAQQVMQHLYSGF